MPKHSKVGASGAERWFNCPGSVALCETVPKQTSVYADEGNKAHDIAEACLEHRCYVDELIDRGLLPDGIDEVPMEMEDAVDMYVEYIRDDIAMRGAILDPKYPTWCFGIEQYVDLSWLHPELFGTCDAYLGKAGNLLTIYDFKYGTSYVEVEHNKQLMYYALGVAYQTKMEFTEIELVIVQPRVSGNKEPIRRAMLEYRILLQFEADLLKAVRATEQKDAPLNKGSWCWFCNAKAVCPEYIGKLSEESGFDVVVDEPKELPKPQTMVLTDIAKVLNKGSEVKSWIDTVNEYALNLPEETLAEIGYTKQDKLGNRSWTNVQDALHVLSHAVSDKLALYGEPKIKTPAQMEKIAPGIKDLVNQLCERKATGKKLVKKGKDFKKLT